MSKKLASFMYEGTRYFACLDDGYLQSNFPNTNVVSLDEAQLSAGYSAAIAQPWNQGRPHTCPVSTDATVEKKGDKFVASGTCGGLKFTLTEDSYEIEDEAQTPVESEETAVSEPEEVDSVEEVASVEVEDSATEIESMTEVEPAERESEVEDTEERYEVVGEVVPDQADHVSQFVVTGLDRLSAISEETHEETKAEDPTTVASEKEEPVCTVKTAFMEDSDSVHFMKVGSYAKPYVKVNGRLEMPNRTPEEVISDKPFNHSASKFRGMQLGKRGEVREKVNVAEHVTQPVKQENHKPEPVVKPEPKPIKPASNIFASVPRPADSEFDVDEFLESLSVEQRQLLDKIPESLLGAINEFSQKPISPQRLEELGEVYCVRNRWHICGDWYAIDIVSELSRHFYYAKENMHFSVPTKLLKSWLRYKELCKLA